jgi:hypothetical protein
MIPKIYEFILVVKKIMIMRKLVVNFINWLSIISSLLFFFFFFFFFALSRFVSYTLDGS